MSYLSKIYSRLTAKLSSKPFKIARFSRKQLTIYGTVFAAIGGTLLFLALAAPSTKIWDSQADFDTGSKNQVTVANGAVTLAQAGEVSPAGPTQLTASSSGRYLVDQNGVKQYLDNRQAKKFNTIMANLVEHKWKGDYSTFDVSGGAPSNIFGDKPFTSKISYNGVNYYDLTATNDKYFDYAGQIIQEAANRDIYVFLYPLYLGLWSDEGWYAEAGANGTARCRTYGRYVGGKYKNLTNIVWVMSGDRNPTAAETDCHREMVAGIKENNPNALFTAHAKRNDSARDIFGGETWLNLNSTYTDYLGVPSESLNDYNRSPVMPAFLLEAIYEGESSINATGLRQQSYWSLFSGSTGQFFGHGTLSGGSALWSFRSGWPTSMDATGSREQVHVKSLMDSRRWYRMLPDQNKSVVLNGGGTTPNYIAALRASDGETVMVYISGGQTVNMAMDKVSGGNAKAWWYNPRSGANTSIGTFTASGSRNFSPPSSEDWVLVLDDATKNLSAPGISIAPTPSTTSSYVSSGSDRFLVASS